MAAALSTGLITQEERFGLRALKHRGITDTKGNKADKPGTSPFKWSICTTTRDSSLIQMKKPNFGRIFTEIYFFSPKNEGLTAR